MSGAETPVPQTPVPGLHGVVYVEDLERCAAFYATVAGLDVVERDDGFITLASAQVELSLVRMSTDDATTGLASSEPPGVPERRSEVAVKLSFAVPDLVAAAAAAEAAGGLLDPEDTAWAYRGWRHRHGVDPEGNVVSFREPSTTA